MKKHMATIISLAVYATAWLHGRVVFVFPLRALFQKAIQTGGEPGQVRDGRQAGGRESDQYRCPVSERENGLPRFRL